MPATTIRKIMPLDTDAPCASAEQRCNAGLRGRLLAVGRMAPVLAEAA